MIMMKTSSAPTTPAETRLRLIAASRAFFFSSLRPWRNVISMMSNWSV